MADISRKTAQQIVDTVKEICGHNINFINSRGISGSPEEVRPYARLAERITRLILREQELNAAWQDRNERMPVLLPLSGQFHSAGGRPGHGQQTGTITNICRLRK